MDEHIRENIELKIENLNERIKKIEEAGEREADNRRQIYTRLENLEKHEVTTNINYGHILASIDEIKKDVREIKDKPHKRYELIINTIISAIIGGSIGALITWIIQNK